MISVPSSEVMILCLFLSAVLSACLYLFFSTKVDLRRIEARLGEHRNTAKRKTAESELRFSLLETKFGEVAEKLQLIDQALEQAKEPVLRNTIGPTRGKRTAIIRLAQKGEGADKIAASVGMPKNEVDLLLKVHRAIATRVLPQLQPEESAQAERKVVEEVFGARP